MKMSAWEHQFDDRIAKIRRLEINQISKANRLKALNEAIYFSVNVVVPIVIFLVHVNSGGVLNPRVVFTTMSFINILQLEVTKHFSIGVMVSVSLFSLLCELYIFGEVYMYMYVYLYEVFYFVASDWF